MAAVAAPLDVDLVRRLLGPDRRLARSIEVFSEIDSTNLEATRRARRDPPAQLDGHLLLAERQSEGRGRRGEAWHSPSGGGLYLTSLFETSLPLPSLSLLSVVAGVAAVSALDKLSAPRISLKWPNDLFLGEKKIGGILMDLHSGPSKCLALLGLGLNTHLEKKSFPEDLRDRATSLLIASEAGEGQLPSREQILVHLIEALEPCLRDAEAGRLDRLAAVWKDRSMLLGRTIVVKSRGEILRGVVVDLPLPPTLLLETESGTREIRGEWAHLLEIEPGPKKRDSP